MDEYHEKIGAVYQNIPKKKQSSDHWANLVCFCIVQTIFCSILATVIIIIVRLKILRNQLCCWQRLPYQNLNPKMGWTLKVGDLILTTRVRAQLTMNSLNDRLIGLASAQHINKPDPTHITVVTKVGPTAEETMVVHLGPKGLQFISLAHFDKLYHRNHTYAIGRISKAIDTKAVDRLVERMKSSRIRYSAFESSIAVLMWRGQDETLQMPWHGFDHDGYTCASLIYMMFEELNVFDRYHASQCQIHPSTVLPIDFILEPSEDQKFSSCPRLPWRDGYFITKVDYLMPM